MRRHLAEAEFGLNVERLTNVLLTDKASPRDVLLDRYVEWLTGESLQSVEQVGRACTALGVTNQEFRRRIGRSGTLDFMFRARNQMIHELDLIRELEPGPGVRPKRTRTISEAVRWANEALRVSPT